jgi:clan AA aspartic protease (TIGR02281 family)
MAFRGGMRRAAKEAGLWLGVAGTAVVSFYFFEDAYRTLEQTWPKLQASFALGTKSAAESDEAAQPVGVEETGSIPHHMAETPDLRPTDTGLTELVNRISRPNRRVTLSANNYGHFVAEAEINGVKVELLTDTGATYVALNYETALQLGFDRRQLHFTSRSSTANGIARVAPVNLDYLRIGSIVLHDVKAVIAEPGKMTQNLLGMSFIRRLSGFELTGSLLNMVQN